MPPARSSVAPERRSAGSQTLKSVAVLIKLRVIWLLLFSAVGGAFLAAEGWPGARAMPWLTICGSLVSAGASILNQYLERSSDALMVRTRQRPLVTGVFSGGPWVPIVGSLLIAAPVAAAAFAIPALAVMMLVGAFVYIVVYTLWLKPRTPLNIVIGGAAGSAAVLSGSAAAGQWNAPGAVVLALIVFLWTPTHFWSLAIMYRDDYRQSNIPMLPARAAPRVAAGWVMLHIGATALGALLLATLPRYGWLYTVPIGAATGVLLWQGVWLIIQPGPQRARAVFKTSNLYLASVLLLTCIDLLV